MNFQHNLNLSVMQRGSVRMISCDLKLMRKRLKRLQSGPDNNKRTRFLKIPIRKKKEVSLAVFLTNARDKINNKIQVDQTQKILVQLKIKFKKNSIKTKINLKSVKAMIGFVTYVTQSTGSTTTISLHANVSNAKQRMITFSI